MSDTGPLTDPHGPITRQNLHDEHKDIAGRLEWLTATLIQVSLLQQADHLMTVEHDRILVRGSGSGVSLPEVVRNLTTSLEAFTKAAASKSAEELAVAKDKRDELKKLKWVAIAFLVSVVPAFVWQVVVFWVKVAPTIK